MERKYITILNYEIGEINIYELSGEVLDKFLSMEEADFIREVIGLKPYEIEWMVTYIKPFITDEILTL